MTEDRKISPAAGSSAYYIQLPWEICNPRTIEKFVSYIAGKVLQIQSKIKNFRLWRAVRQILFSYIGKIVTRGQLKNLCYIAGKVLQIQPKIKNSHQLFKKYTSPFLEIYSYLFKKCTSAFLRIQKVLQIGANTAEDQKISKIFACGGQFGILNSITLGNL